VLYLNPIPGYSYEKGLSYTSSGSDARARQDDHFNATIRHLDPFLTAVNDGTLTVDAAIQMLKDTGNYDQALNIAAPWFNTYEKNLGDE
jgi:hypothetical protein